MHILQLDLYSVDNKHSWCVRVLTINGGNMILSNRDILTALQQKHIGIKNLPFDVHAENFDFVNSPFNTTSLDLHLGSKITVPDDPNVATLDLDDGSIKEYWRKHSKDITITECQPFILKPKQLVLANTLEEVDLTIHEDSTKGSNYAARIEGRSSFARCGILIHLTAPTIHAGFSGTITLEVLNVGTHPMLLKPGLSICQLILEMVQGVPEPCKGQYHGQNNPIGDISVGIDAPHH